MKAFASDFDGTLYFGLEEGFHEEDLLAIQKYQKQGNLFGICTGRAIIGMDRTVKDLISFDFYILNSGARILDKNRNVIYEKRITREQVCKIYEYVDSSYEFKVVSDSVYILNAETDRHIQLNDIKELEEESYYSISIMTGSEKEAHTLYTLLLSSMDDISVMQNKNGVDIAAKGCTKGSAIEYYKEYANLEMIAGIGDSYNDISMLESADIGFTFFSSSDCVKNNADILVNSVEEAISYLLQ